MIVAMYIIYLHQQSLNFDVFPMGLDGVFIKIGRAFGCSFQRIIIHMDHTESTLITKLPFWEDAQKKNL